MKNRLQHIVTVIIISMIVSMVSNTICVKASDGEDYIVISVNAVDDNPDLEYAIDSDDPTAFSKSNEFRVPSGTSHTIYVKDVAGNITSQRYEPQDQAGEDVYKEEDEQLINIDLELERNEEEDQEEEVGNPGTASVSERVKTDGSVDADKVFYTFSTKEGEELYLIIDQARGSDNVYLLDTVSLADLRVLAENQESTDKLDNDKEDNLLSILASEEETDSDVEKEDLQQSKAKSSTSSFSTGLIILLLSGVFGGIYYYLKIYQKKKEEVMDTLDAMDMEEFEADDESEEEIGFEYDDEEKERYLESLMNEEEESAYVDADPDEYVAEYSESEAGEDSDEEEDPFGNIEI